MRGSGEAQATMWELLGSWAFAFALYTVATQITIAVASWDTVSLGALRRNNVAPLKEIDSNRCAQEPRPKESSTFMSIIDVAESEKSHDGAIIKILPHLATRL